MAMYCSLCFDTEDYTSPEHWGMDDIPKWCAEIMTEEGIIGTFLIIGSKARSIRDRGRTDVIAALRKHEIGLHTQFGSEHPTLVESQAPLEWHEAVEQGDLREGAGHRELAEIFNTNIGSWSTHGASQTAAMHYVAGVKYDRPWLYSFATNQQKNNLWYAYCFQFGFYGLQISEAAYSQPDQVTATLARWEKQVEELHSQGHKWIMIFMAHPLMIRAKQFNDALNFADGKNRIPWVTPEMRTPEEMEIAKQQFRRVVRWIRKHPKLNNKSLYDTYRILGQRKAKIARAELAAYATIARRNQSIRAGGYSFSAGEALVALAEGLLAKDLPNANAVRQVLGPIGETPRMPDNYLSTLQSDGLKSLARGILSHVNATGMLPSVLPCPNGAGRMGLPTIYHVLCDGWLQKHEHARELAVRVPHICNRYPQYTDEIEARARRGWLNWPIHDINMPLETLSRHFRLQCWTWKDLYDGSDKPFWPEGEKTAAVVGEDEPASGGKRQGKRRRR